MYEKEKIQSDSYVLPHDLVCAIREYADEWAHVYSGEHSGSDAGYAREAEIKGNIAKLDSLITEQAAEADSLRARLAKVKAERDALREVVEPMTVLLSRAGYKVPSAPRMGADSAFDKLRATGVVED